MSVCRWGCVWQMSPGGRWSRVSGASRVPGDLWISVGVLEPAQVLHAHRETNWVMMQNRGTMGNVVCVCGCDSSFFLDGLRTKTHWSVGGIFFNMLGGTGNYLVLWAAACLYWFLFHWFSGEILHIPAPYTVTLKEKVFLFYLFASS